MFKIPQPDGVLSASDIKGLAVNVVGQLTLPGIEGSPLDPGDIWAVVTLATVNQTSIWETCNERDETPCDDTVMTWLHTLNQGCLEFGADLLFMSLALTILDPERSRIVSIDFVVNPYHGVHDEDDGELCRRGAKNGTTTCHRYCTAYLVSNGKPVTLAMTYVRNDETEADARERVLDRVAAYPFDIDLLLADRDFYNERILRRSREIAATIVPVQKKGDRLKDTQIIHDDLSAVQRPRAGGPARGLCLLPGGRPGQTRRGRRGYAACDLEDRTPTQVERRYRKRSAIETSYQLFRQARPITMIQDPIIRFAFVLVGFLLENLWLVLRWAVIARPRRGGRDLPEEFTFTVFCDWIRLALEEELDRRWEIEMNGVGVPTRTGRPRAEASPRPRACSR